MTSVAHDAMAELIRRNPELVRYLLTVAGYPVPGGPVALTDSQLPAWWRGEWRPRFADTVLLIGPHPGRSGTRDRRPWRRRPWPRPGSKLAVVAEVQTSEPSSRQRIRQHGYLANAADRHQCKAVIIALCLTDDIARSCARPFWPGQPRMRLHVIAFGPRNTPRPGTPGTEPVAAELAVIGALNGTLDLTDAAHRALVLGALALTDSELRLLYTEFIYFTAPPQAARALEADMTTAIPGYRVPFLRDAINQGLLQGREEGRELGLEQGSLTEAARMLWQILQARGLTTDDDIHDRIDHCVDRTQLETWAVRAVTASSVEEIFAVPGEVRDSELAGSR
jgi:hypothetical protein